MSIGPERTSSEEFLLKYLLGMPSDENVATIIYKISPTEMFDEKNREIFVEIRNLFENGQTISLASVAIAFNGRENSKKLIEKIVSLNSDTMYSINSADIDNHVTLVKEQYAKERFAEVLQKAIRHGQSPNTKVSDLFEFTVHAQEIIANLAADIRNPESVVTHGYTAIKNLKEKRESADGSIFSGIQQLDACYGGLQDNDLMIVAARPNVGKTVLLTQMFRACLDQKRKALFFSLEMAPAQIFARLQSITSGISPSAFRNPKTVSDQDIKSIEDAFDVMRIESQDKYLFVEGSYKNPSIDRLRLSAYKQKQTVGLDIVFVDYLQILRPRNQNLNRPDLEIKEVTQDLKTLAEMLKVPIVCVSALNREASEVKFTKDKGYHFVRPQLGHLSGSSGIEYIADQVVLIHRQEGEIDTELILAKNRWGPTRTINAGFDGAMCQFVSYQF